MCKRFLTRRGSGLRIYTHRAGCVAKLLDGRHVERIALQPDDGKPFGGKSLDDAPQSLKPPRIVQARQGRVDLDDDMLNPHLEAESPERVRPGRDKFDKSHARIIT